MLLPSGFICNIMVRVMKITGYAWLDSDEDYRYVNVSPIKRRSNVDCSMRDKELFIGKISNDGIRILLANIHSYASFYILIEKHL